MDRDKSKFSNNISQGQELTYEIAIGVLNEFQLSSIDSDEHEANYMFLERLAKEDLIINDQFTGSKISTGLVSDNYVDWLVSVSNLKTSIDLKNFNFNRMIFNGSVEGSWEKDKHRLIYKGGVRNPFVTARATLTLVANAILPVDYLDVSYFINSGITIVHAGNHRMLSYKLIGSIDFPKDKLNCYNDDMHIEALNHALLDFEKWFHGVIISDLSESIKSIEQVHKELINNPNLLKFLQSTYLSYHQRKIFVKLLLIDIEVYELLVLEKSKFKIVKFVKNLLFAETKDHYKESLKLKMKKWLIDNDYYL